MIGSTVSASQPLVTARYGHTASVLSTGQVLVIGGFDANSAPLASVEVLTVSAGSTTGAVSSTAPAATTAPQGIPISITPVPSTAVIPAQSTTSNAGGQFLGQLLTGLVGQLIGMNLGSGQSAALTPNITSLNPNTAVHGSTVVVVQVTGIGAYLSVALDNGTGSPVFLSNSNATAYSNGSSVQISFTVPSSLPAGTYNVDVITSSYATAGSAAAMAEGTLTVQ
jgi:hypothetical protein